jgi:Tol biopolymer transport system component
LKAVFELVVFGAAAQDVLTTLLQTGSVRALLVLGVLASFVAIPAAAAPPAGTIVFSRTVGEQAELYSIHPDGSGLKRLTREPAYDSEPTWSPNGSLIAAFGAGGVVIRTRDGSVVRRIVIPTEGIVAELRWSPDGTWLSYLVEHCQYEDPRGYVLPPCADLWVARPDGSESRRLLDRDVDMLEDASYGWSPGSRRLVYEALSTGPTTLAIVDLPSGSNRRIAGTAGAADPTWSRRGEVAFVRGRTIYAVQPSGRGLRRLARGRWLSRPAWSPSGRRLAYLAAERADVGNRWGVWTVGVDGRRRLRVGTATDDREFAWSPDSTRLLWENFLGRLIVARADRRGSARFLTRGTEPDWR